MHFQLLIIMGAFATAASARRVTPAPSIDVPYDSSVQEGRGYNHRTGQWLAHPFEEYTDAFKVEDETLSAPYERRVVKSTDSFSEAISSTASVSGGGWSVQAKAEAAFDREITMTSKDVVFLIHAKKDLGFEGWEFSKVPSFTEAAKEALCDTGNSRRRADCNEVHCSPDLSGYETNRGLACSGRNEICANNQEPCKSANTPEECKAVCDADSSCVSFEFTMLSKNCQASSTCTRELGSGSWKDITLYQKGGSGDNFTGGSFTPANFESIYGTYYVRGANKGSALDIWIRVNTKTSSTNQKISSSLEASWTGVAYNAEGSATFSHALNRESSVTSSHIRAKSYGAARDWHPHPTVETVDDVIDEWAGMTSANGAGISLHLDRYDDHPDYLRIKQECGGDDNDLLRDEQYISLISDLAIEAMLIAEEITEKTRGQFEECLFDLGVAFRDFHDGLVALPEDQANDETWKASFMALDALKSQWNAETNACDHGLYSKLITGGDCCRGNGADLDSFVDIPTPEHCEFACDANNQCKYFSHSTEWNNCILCSECQISTMHDAGYYTAWKKNTVANVQPSVYNKIHNNGDCCRSNGAKLLNIGNNQAPTPDVCKAACDALDSCLYFAHSDMFKNCGLCSACNINTSGFSDVYTAWERVVSGRRLEKPVSVQYAQLSDGGHCCRTGGLVGHVGDAPKPSDCESACDTDPQCSHFSHSKYWENCMLCSDCELTTTGMSRYYTSWRKDIVDGTRRIEQ